MNLSSDILVALQLWGIVPPLIAIIAIGAAAHTLTHLRASRKSKTPFDIIDIGISYVIATFAGIMFALGSVLITADALVMYASSGIGSFSGLTGINRLIDVALDGLVNRIARHGSGVRD